MNSRHFKTKKSLIGFIIAVILIQVCIIFLAVFMIKDSEIIPKEELKSADIVVAFTEYREGFSHIRPKFFVFADGKEFVFNTASWAEYSCSDLNDTVLEGDELSILYYEKAAISETENIVVDARSGETVYRSYESYAEDDPIFSAIAIAFMFELFFSIGIFFKFRFT